MELHNKLKVTGIAVTHDMTSAYKIANRIAMLYNGKIVANGTPDEIKNTKDPIVHQFITGAGKGPYNRRYRFRSFNKKLNRRVIMDSAKTFELKVGIFIMIGIAILFFIVFSVGEINFSKTGYKIKVLFSFANGIGGTAPVRLAGVGIGQVQGIKIMRDEKTNTTKAELTVWINDNTKIENDAVVTINTLGLLGEKYLEIFPGTPGKPSLKNNDTDSGKDPVPMEKIHGRPGKPYRFGEGDSR